jgi:hypothetical protein
VLMSAFGAEQHEGAQPQDDCDFAMPPYLSRTVFLISSSFLAIIDTFVSLI